MRPLRVARKSVARGLVKAAIVFILVPALGACHRPQPTPRIPAGYQPIAGGPVHFTFPQKGQNLPVQVRVDASPPGSVGFRVYTDQQWRELSEKSQPVDDPAGTGTSVAGEPGELLWQGSSADAGIYHVQVYPVRQPAAFKIAFGGAGSGGSTLNNGNATPVGAGEEAAASTLERPSVSIESIANAQPVRPARTTTGAAAALPPVASGAGPVASAALGANAKASRAVGSNVAQQPMALTGMGNFNDISDQAMEFVFEYPGGNRPVNVIVEAKPAGSVGFSVYTDQQWNLFGGGELGIPPVGKGTVNPNEPGSLFWRGISASPGLYHVRVYRQSEPAAFWIALTGEGAAELSARSPAVTQP